MKKKIICILVPSFAVILLILSSILIYFFLPRTYKFAPYIWTENDLITINTYQSLNIVDGEFTILQLSDIQVSNLRDLKETEHQISNLIRNTKPNLIVLAGDNVSMGNNVNILKRFINFFDSFDIPWTTVLGNHDSEGIASRSYVAHMYEISKNSLFKNGPTNIHGNGNYVLNIKEGNNIVTSLIFMDSNEYRIYDDISGYDYIYQDQIDWYEWNIKNLSKLQYGEFNPSNEKVIPSLCFFHIPLMEYATAYDLYSEGLLEGSGSNDELCCTPNINTGLFFKAVDLSSTKGFFVGHDHINNSIITYEGITLAYGLKSSRSSYYDENKIGGTLIKISNNSSFTVTHQYFD